MPKRANDEGSIWRRKDGRWSGAYFVPKPGGGRQRKYVYGHSREEVNRKLVELMAQVHRGVPVATTTDTVSTYLEQWLIEVVKQRLRPKTYEGYANNVRKHIVPRISRKKLNRLTARDVRLMLDDLRASGLSQRSVRYVHATLRTALEHAVREEVLARNVARLVRVAMPERHEQRSLSVEEAKRLLKAARDDRLFAAYVLTLVLGLRRGETLGLRWSDIDFERQVLNVRQNLQRVDCQLQLLPPKTPRSRRAVPLPPICIHALLDHQRRQAGERTEAREYWHDTGLVFVTSIGTPIDPRNFTRLFHEMCESAGVPAVRLHDLRHTCVSLLLVLGVHPRVVMEIVGHAAVEMTMNVYGHVVLDAQREALTQLNDLLDE
jgi:integrase